MVADIEPISDIFSISVYTGIFLSSNKLGPPEELIFRKLIRAEIIGAITDSNWQAIGMKTSPD